MQRQCKLSTTLFSRNEHIVIAKEISQIADAFPSVSTRDISYATIHGNMKGGIKGGKTTSNPQLKFKRELKLNPDLRSNPNLNQIKIQIKMVSLTME